MSIIPNINNQSIAILSDIEQWKEDIADAINTKGGNSTPDESFQQLAEDIRNLDDTFITYGVTTNGKKIDWLKFVTAPKAEYRSFIKEIDNDEITSIENEGCFSNCVNLTKIRFKNLKKISASAMNAFYGCTLLSEIECDNLLSIEGHADFSNCPSLKRLNLPNLMSISGPNAFLNSPFTNINIPKCSVLSQHGIFGNPSNLKNFVVGKLTSMHVNVFGTSSNRMNFLKNFTIGVNTDIDLPLYQWTATVVIAEGQSGIDELNSNLRTNLLEKLYDHSNNGETRILQIGWLDYVTPENIAYANAKGWTLTS